MESLNPLEVKVKTAGRPHLLSSATRESQERSIAGSLGWMYTGGKPSGGRSLGSVTVPILPDQVPDLNQSLNDDEQRMRLPKCNVGETDISRRKSTRDLFW